MKTQTKIILAVVMLALYLVGFIGMASAIIIDSVSMSPSEIAPGESAVIRIEIENNGEDDIEDVSVSLDLSDVPFAPFNSATDYNIDEIEEDESESAKFEVIALNDAKSEIYKIPVVISYVEDGDVVVKNSLISVTVNSKPVIGVSIENGLLLKGKEKEILVEVINKGLSDARFVEVSIGSSSLFSVRGSRSYYIGDVVSDDFDSVKFKVRFDKDVGDKVSFPVIVVYKDGLNNEYSEEFNILVDVYSRENAIELGLIEESKVGLYFGVVVGLVVVYFGYKKFKKWRKGKDSKEDLE